MIGVGNTVKVKGVPGPGMVVLYIENDVAGCCWFNYVNNAWQLESHQFEIGVLVSADAETVKSSFNLIERK